ncbi:MAG: hypothetical protein NT091_01190 [Candidatus Falkowbacteria bacterium]|nr:hypothetical protein [Candidatus Falkowbacteria bacterium]
MLMQTPKNKIGCEMSDRTRQVLEEGERTYKLNREAEKQKILEARENPPHGKKVFNFDIFANLYQMPDEVDIRVPIHDVREETKLNYEWKFYFNSTFTDCKNEEEFAKKLHAVDEER